MIYFVEFFAKSILKIIKQIMLGFELNSKGRKILASLENGVVSLIATQISRGSINSIVAKHLRDAKQLSSGSH